MAVCCYCVAGVEEYVYTVHITDQFFADILYIWDILYEAMYSVLIFTDHVFIELFLVQFFKLNSILDLVLKDAVNSNAV